MSNRRIHRQLAKYLRATLLAWLLALTPYCSTFAQKPIAMHTLWAPPQVHVLFGDYTISFTIRDVNKALQLLEGIGDSAFAGYRLDTGADKQYTAELLPSISTEYKNTLQPMLQNGVGAFLISAGHALVQNRKHRVRTDIIMDRGTNTNGAQYVLMKFYDARTGQLIFMGMMNADMYRQDLGVDIE